MEKLKQGKLDKKTYWIALGIICLLMVLLGVNTSAGDPLGDSGRMAVGVIALIIMLVSCIMRLRDAGKSMVHLLLVFILPGYIFLIAFYESEEPLSAEELAQIQAEVEKMDR